MFIFTHSGLKRKLYVGGKPPPIDGSATFYNAHKPMEL